MGLPLVSNAVIPNMSAPSRELPTPLLPPRPMAPVPIPEATIDMMVIAAVPSEVWAEFEAFIAGKRSGQLVLDFKTGLIQSYKVYKVIASLRGTNGAGVRGPAAV